MKIKLIPSFAHNFLILIKQKLEKKNKSIERGGHVHFIDIEVDLPILF